MQPNYRGYAQQTPSRASHGNTRRGGIGPMLAQQPQLTQAQIHQQAQAQQMASDQAKRRSRKPTDKNLPDAIEDVIIGDGAMRYKDLRDFERRLDATMTRKRLDIVDSINRKTKRSKTLRIWVTNTVENQPWQTSPEGVDIKSTDPPSYRVKIEGRLLDDEADALERAEDPSSGGDKIDEDTAAANLPPPPPPPAQPAQPKGKKGKKTTAATAAAAAAASSITATTPFPVPTPKPRLSTFFREMNVVFPTTLPSSSETTVHWKKPDPPPTRPGGHHHQAAHPPPGADFDELTFKRVSDVNIPIVIKLTRHEDPERFVLSPDLTAVVDMTEGTRTEVTVGIWEYVKMNGLQEEDEKRNFRCDDLLKNITGRETGYLPNLNEYISAHLRPIPEVELPYTVRVDQQFHDAVATAAAAAAAAGEGGDGEGMGADMSMATVYDIRVSVDDTLRNKMLPLITSPTYASMLKEVSVLDEQLALLVQAIQHSRAKHGFLTSMAAQPVGFTRGWISSQKRDLEYVMGEAPRGGGEDALADEWRRVKGGKWEGETARESVVMMLARQGGR